MKKPEYVLPEQFIERLKLLYDDQTFKQIISAMTNKRPTTFRTNTIKIAAPELLKKLEKQNVRVVPVPWNTNAFILEKPTLRELMELPEYKNGELYVQSLSSMIPALVLNPKSNETVLDLCAAPGSKTTQIAMTMANTGKIIANDNSKIRLYKLAANLKTLGITNTMVINMAGQILWQTYPEYFDKTLVDVPCTMEGRININDPKSYKYWSTGKIKELSERQKWLLRAGISTVKPGGTIIYSTCTLAPEENEGVIDWILKKEKGHIQLEEIKIPQLSLSSGIMKWKEKIYSSEITKTVRVLPSETMEGFFIAKIKKLSSSVFL